MFGSFFVGGVSVAVVLYLVIKRRRKLDNRPNISIMINETDEMDYERPDYSSLRVSQCSNECMNPLYEDFEKYGSSLNKALEEPNIKLDINQLD